MDVLFYLKDLLESQQTIGIVGLGSLYKKKSPGKYDLEKHAFIPPTYILTFTDEISESEELVNTIVEQENIDIDSAKLKVQEFVDDIHARLADEKQATLETLGKFVLNNNQLNFIPENESNFGNEFYGLPILNETIEKVNADEIKISEIAEENKLAEENPGQLDLNEHTEKSESAKVNFEEEGFVNYNNRPKLTGKTFTPNYDYDDDYQRVLSRPVKIILRTLLVIAIISTIGGLAYFFNPQYFDGFLNGNDNTSIDTQAPPQLLDSSKTETDSSKVDTNQLTQTPNLDSAVVLVKEPEPVKSTQITYEVIGSAEKSQKRIDQVINAMKKKGIEAKALKNVPGKLVKISLGSFTNFNIAKKYQDSLKKKLNNPEIYIQTIKPKI